MREIKTYTFLVLLLGMKFHLIKSGQLVVKRCTTKTGEIMNVPEEASPIKQTMEKPLESLEQLQSVTTDPKNVCRLILSHSNVGYIPNGLFYNFSKLMELSLNNNNISTIAANAFIGLTTLKTLNLSGNPIQQWNTTEILHETPQLRTLDMTSTSPWKPGATILSLPFLKVVKGISWSQQCSRCSLVKSANKTQISQYANDSYRFLKGYACRSEVISPSKFVRHLAKYGFLATCLLDNQSLCFKSEIKVAVKAPCRETSLSVMYAEFCLGPLAIILNLLVIGTVVTSKRLRQNHDMILVTNIAIGDLCNGIYSVVIISVHVTRTFEQMEVIAQRYCTYIGCFWILGISLAATSSLVLTIERHKGIVRTRNRLNRMTATEVILALLVSWAIALSVMLLPAFGIGHYSVNTYCIPIFPVKSMPVQYYYSITMAGIAATIYFITIPIYLRIYMFVRKSSKKMRVRTDIELAKRVFTLVISNMLFFLLPSIISLVFSRVSRNTSTISREVSEVLNSAFPLVCLTINSVLNPALYAFRSRHFRKEIATLRGRLRRRALANSAGLNSRSPYVFSNRACAISS